MQGPPAYMSSAGPPPFHSRRSRCTFPTLPPHILLQVVYSTFPQTDLRDEGRVERQRKTLYWLSISLRLVNHALYIACMHVLRSTYLPAYDALVRPPYSSDPFPLQAPSEDMTQISRAPTLQRETATLDLFIALKVREDVWADDSELHLERDESFKDLFDLTQPKSRLEDLVRVYGLREGVFGPLHSATNSTTNIDITPVSFAHISVTFSPRKVGLALSTVGKRTIAETPRNREERLESAAKRLVKELRVWLEENS
ncbi:hypothetical protein BDZ94DRAFT_1279865 [Collybia nuda]|uniref:Uncharacterized protein n=1 Tax=Collybia nuda TaxID=64659 RepID=A0A9P5YGS9_9AGAR|nr:hypothetical protein BDZ94DRAFT_1279865 [Collybia nuda]